VHVLGPCVPVHVLYIFFYPPRIPSGRGETKKQLTNGLNKK